MWWNAQKPDFVFRPNGRVHLNWRGRQFSRLLAAEVCASAVVMLDTPCSEVVWRVLATHAIHFPSLRHRVPSHFNWTLPLALLMFLQSLSLLGSLKTQFLFMTSTFVGPRFELYNAQRLTAVFMSEQTLHGNKPWPSGPQTLILSYEQYLSQDKQ